MPVQHSRQRIVKRIFVREMPDRQREFSSRLEHALNFADRIGRRRKKHRAEAADHRIERAGRKRQAVRERHIELHILHIQARCRPTRRFDHSRDRIDPTDLAFSSDQASQA